MVLGQIINIDHRQISVDTVGLFGDAEFDFDFNNNASTKTDNRTFMGLRIISNMSFFTHQHQVFFKNRLSHYRFNKNQILNRGFSHLRINFFYKRKLGYEIFSQVNFDMLRSLNFRNSSGGGIRYVIIKNTDTEFEVGTGAIFEYEVWEDQENSLPVRKRLAKSNSYLGFYKNLGHYGVSFLYLYQTGYDKSIDKFRNRMTGFFAFDDFINNHITLILRIEFHYDHLPIVPNKKFTYALSNAIRFHF